MQTKSTPKILAAISVLVLAALACTRPDFSDMLSRFTDQVQNQVENVELPASNPPVQVSSDLLSQQDALISIYQAVSPGVVSIAVATDQGSALGSGFVFDSEGHIVTNYHVVQGANYIEVSFTSGYKAVGDVIGVDTDSDLAVIDVDAPASELHPVSMGDSDALQVGQYVVAIGNPFGLNGSMSIGIVSSLGRTLDSMNEAPGPTGNFFSAGDIIQTDAAINPGNSGGPLLNLHGEVIGVNRAIRSYNFNDSGETLNSGVGFAVSGNIVKRVVPSLIATGSYDYPYLGVTSLSNMTLADAQELGLESTVGAYVSEVSGDGPAAKAGVEAGDMIVGIDGLTVTSFDQLIAYLFTHESPGDTVVLHVMRGGQEIEIDLTLGARP
jgi:2-alkenal reductase